MRARRLVIVSGSADATALRVCAASTGLAAAEIAWISPSPPPESSNSSSPSPNSPPEPSNSSSPSGRRSSSQPSPSAPSSSSWMRPRELVRALGRSFDVVVLDGHGRLDPEQLGQAHGLVRGGGALVLRLDPEHARPAAEARMHLAAYPFTPADVGQRFAAHLRRVLGDYAEPLMDRLEPGDRAEAGTPEQAAVVAALVADWTRPIPPDPTAATPPFAVLIADRGRGKSSALGLALAELAARDDARERLVTGPSEAAVAELLRFANRHAPAARFVALPELLAGPPRAAVIVVDEAAQLPVPLLQRLVVHQHEAALAFATTTHGYEGTGRGFVLRFLAWLRGRGPVIRHELREPIRWAAGDPVEQAVFEALLLDAEPAPLPELSPEPDPIRASRPSTPPNSTRAGASQSPIASPTPSFERLDRDALIADLPQLRALFGLLVHAHYRTTPGDLERLLDAPNLEVHAARQGGQIVAANLIAREGALPAEQITAASTGQSRLRAHALADVLVAHLGHPEAGALSMRRSVRLATHPHLRSRGLARALVEHTHALAAAEPEPPALFGTLFGATPELVGLRRSLGYELVRISAARGARTGEPSLVMLRPCAPAAVELLANLRAELAREIDTQLLLLRADDGLSLDPALVTELRAGLPAPIPYTEAEAEALTRAYAYGPRTFESVATAVRVYLATIGRDRLARLDPRAFAVVEGRARNLHGWRRVALDSGLISLPATMRALRRAIRELLAAM
jgi:tRNA(Met) cytidine acetyltransferase